MASSRRTHCHLYLRAARARLGACATESRSISSRGCDFCHRHAARSACRLPRHLCACRRHSFSLRSGARAFSPEACCSWRHAHFSGRGLAQRAWPSPFSLRDFLFSYIAVHCRARAGRASTAHAASTRSASLGQASRAALTWRTLGATCQRVGIWCTEGQVCICGSKLKISHTFMQTSTCIHYLATLLTSTGQHRGPHTSHGSAHRGPALHWTRLARP